MVRGKKINSLFHIHVSSLLQKHFAIMVLAMINEMRWRINPEMTNRIVR